MKKFKYYKYEDTNKGCGEAEIVLYINAYSEEHAVSRIKAELGEYDRIGYGLKEVEEFIQPQQIKVI